MFKRLFHILALSLVVLSAFASASPALAHSGSANGKVKGSIAAVDAIGGSVTVTSASGANVTLKVDASTIIRKNDAPITLADLNAGDMVEAKYNPSTMLASKIEVNLPKFKGSISAIDAAAGTLTVTSQGGAAMTFTVDANTVIKLNGAYVSLSNLLVGYRVEVKYDAATMLAFKIEAKYAAGGTKFAKVKGLVAAVDAIGGSVTVTSASGANVTLKVDASTIIRKNDAPITLADLNAGDMVEAKYNPSTMLASKIEVNLPKFKGSISAIDAAAGTLTVTSQGGAAMTFTVDANTVIKLNGAYVSLSNLLVGYRVEVKYDAATMLAFKIEAKR